MRGTLTICAASQILATSSVLGLATVTPLVSASLGVAPHWIGYQVSLIYLAGIVASALSGSLVRRYGAARLNQAALYCTGGGFAGLASGSLPVMIGCSLLIGVGYAFNNPCSSHMLHRITPAHLRNLVFSVKQAGVPAGGVLAALVVPHLSDALGWQRAILVCAIPSLLLGTLFGLLRAHWDDDREPGAPVSGQILRNQAIVWSSPGLSVLSLLGLVYSAVQLSVSAFTVTMLVSDFHWTAVRAAAAAAAVQVCGAVGRIGWGLVADRLNAGFLVLSLIGAATALCCVALLAAPVLPPVALLGLFGVMGFCAVGWNGVMLAETARLSPHAVRGIGSGTLTGDVLVYTFVGVVVGPSTFAALYAHLGSYTETFAFFALPALLGTLMAGWAHRTVPAR